MPYFKGILSSSGIGWSFSFITRIVDSYLVQVYEIKLNVVCAEGRSGKIFSFLLELLLVFELHCLL